MSDILNLQVKDDTLNNVLSNNPFYIDIKGSVNICLIRCGQEIETCNNIQFSTMTNYGKVLVLTPNKNSIGKCLIKLAFDTNNDSTNDTGNANYIFEKAMITVPSLHRLNGQIFDMETFLIFSSTQKNGDVLYVCLCALSMGTSMVQNNDWKLLNYKLIDELCVKSNKIPDMYGTSSINGSPNPVDIGNFIPPEGMQNFYDYTHPLNTKVNFRVFQTPLAVSNDALTALKNKLTPGNIYENFKYAIGKTINPTEGLFFYFSEDLTDRYKSFSINNPNSLKVEKSDKCLTDEDVNKKIDNMKKNGVNFRENYTIENLSDNIIKDQELHEKNTEFKKLDVKKKSNEKKLKKNSDDDTDVDKFDENVEIFDSNIKESSSNDSNTIIYIIIAFLFIFNLIGFTFIFNIFNGSENSKQIDFSQLNITNEIKKLICIKFNYFINTVSHAIITIIILLLFSFYVIGKNNNRDTGGLYVTLCLFLVIVFGIGVLALSCIGMYSYNHLIGIGDQTLLEKEYYFFKKLRESILKGNILYNTWNSMIGNFDFMYEYNPSNTPMTGGGNYNAAPGINSNINNEIAKENIKNNKTVTDVIDIIKCQFSQKVNASNPFIWKCVFFIVFIFIAGIVFQNYVIGLNPKVDIGLKWLLSFNVTLYSFSPFGFILMLYSFLSRQLWLKIITGFFVLGGLIFSGLLPCNPFVIPNVATTVFSNLFFALFMYFYIIAFMLVCCYFAYNYINRQYLMTDEEKMMQDEKECKESGGGNGTTSTSGTSGSGSSGSSYTYFPYPPVDSIRNSDLRSSNTNLRDPFSPSAPPSPPSPFTPIKGNNNKLLVTNRPIIINRPNILSQNNISFIPRMIDNNYRKREKNILVQEKLSKTQSIIHKLKSGNSISLEDENEISNIFGKKEYEKMKGGNLRDLYLNLKNKYEKLRENYLQNDKLSKIENIENLINSGSNENIQNLDVRDVLKNILGLDDEKISILMKHTDNIILKLKDELKSEKEKILDLQKLYTVEEIQNVFKDGTEEEILQMFENHGFSHDIMKSLYKNKNDIISQLKYEVEKLKERILIKEKLGNIDNLEVQLENKIKLNEDLTNNEIDKYLIGIGIKPSILSKIKSTSSNSHNTILKLKKELESVKEKLKERIVLRDKIDNIGNLENKIQLGEKLSYNDFSSYLTSFGINTSILAGFTSDTENTIMRLKKELETTKEKLEERILITDKIDNIGNLENKIQSGEKLSYDEISNYLVSIGINPSIISELTSDTENTIMRLKRELESTKEKLEERILVKNRIDNIGNLENKIQLGEKLSYDEINNYLSGIGINPSIMSELTSESDDRYLRLKKELEITKEKLIEREKFSKIDELKEKLLNEIGSNSSIENNEAIINILKESGMYNKITNSSNKDNYIGLLKLEIEKLKEELIQRQISVTAKNEKNTNNRNFTSNETIDKLKEIGVPQNLIETFEKQLKDSHEKISELKAKLEEKDEKLITEGRIHKFNKSITINEIPQIIRDEISQRFNIDPKILNSVENNKDATIIGLKEEVRRLKENKIVYREKLSFLDNLKSNIEAGTSSPNEIINFLQKEGIKTDKLNKDSYSKDTIILELKDKLNKLKQEQLLSSIKLSILEEFKESALTGNKITPETIKLMENIGLSSIVKNISTHKDDIILELIEKLTDLKESEIIKNKKLLSLKNIQKSLESGNISNNKIAEIAKLIDCRNIDIISFNKSENLIILNEKLNEKIEKEILKNERLSVIDYHISNLRLEGNNIPKDQLHKISQIFGLNIYSQNKDQKILQLEEELERFKSKDKMYSRIDSYKDKDKYNTNNSIVETLSDTNINVIEQVGLKNKLSSILKEKDIAIQKLKEQLESEKESKKYYKDSAINKKLKNNNDYDEDDDDNFYNGDIISLSDKNILTSKKGKSIVLKLLDKLNKLKENEILKNPILSLFKNIQNAIQQNREIDIQQTADILGIKDLNFSKNISSIDKNKIILFINQKLENKIEKEILKNQKLFMLENYISLLSKQSTKNIDLNIILEIEKNLGIDKSSSVLYTDKNQKILLLQEELNKKKESEKLFREKLTDLKKSEIKYIEYGEEKTYYEKILENEKKLDEDYILKIRGKLNNCNSKLKLLKTYINTLKKHIYRNNEGYNNIDNYWNDDKNNNNDNDDDDDEDDDSYLIYMKNKLKSEKEKKLLAYESIPKEKTQRIIKSIKPIKSIDKLNEILLKIKLNSDSLETDIRDLNFSNNLMKKICDEIIILENALITDIYKNTKEETLKSLINVVEKLNNNNLYEPSDDEFEILSKNIDKLITIKNISILQQIYLIIPFVNEMREKNEILAQLAKFNNSSIDYDEVIKDINIDKPDFIKIKNYLAQRIIVLLNELNLFKKNLYENTKTIKDIFEKYRFNKSVEELEKFMSDIIIYDNIQLIDSNNLMNIIEEDLNKCYKLNIIIDPIIKNKIDDNKNELIAQIKNIIDGLISSINNENKTNLNKFIEVLRNIFIEFDLIKNILVLLKLQTLIKLKDNIDIKKEILENINSINDIKLRTEVIKVNTSNIEKGIGSIKNGLEKLYKQQFIKLTNIIEQRKGTDNKTLKTIIN